MSSTMRVGDAAERPEPLPPRDAVVAGDGHGLVPVTPPDPIVWSLHDELLTRLRDHVVEGRIPVGARVPERALCELFGVSRTPLREALKVLASEGLIELLPNRGARVRGIEPGELVALFELVGGLEALAGRLACECITDDAFAEIEDLHHAMYACYLRRDLHGYFARNQAIHERIVAAAANAPLRATYATVTGRLRRARYSANLNEDRDRWGEAVREHEAILDALRRRAGAELADILFMHLRNTQRAAAGQSHSDGIGSEV